LNGTTSPFRVITYQIVQVSSLVGQLVAALPNVTNYMHSFQKFVAVVVEEHAQLALGLLVGAETLNDFAHDLVGFEFFNPINGNKINTTRGSQIQGWVVIVLLEQQTEPVLGPVDGALSRGGGLTVNTSHHDRIKTTQEKIISTSLIYSSSSNNQKGGME
jgi:hypothetical protein